MAFVSERIIRFGASPDLPQASQRLVEQCKWRILAGKSGQSRAILIDFITHVMVIVLSLIYAFITATFQGHNYT